MKTLLSFAFLLLTAVAFAGEPVFARDTDGSEVIRMRINSSRADCNGYSGNTHCFMVQKGASIGMDHWEMLREPIEGLNYEEGFVYDITVKIEEIPNAAPGEQRVKYILVDVISKTAVG
jgi:hypothetical protein